MTAERETEHTLLPTSCLLSSITVDSELDGLYYNVSFAHLTKEETAADVKASAMKEGPDNELDKPQSSTIKKKLFSSSWDGNDAVINYHGLFNKSRIAVLLWTTKICDEDPNYRIEAEVCLNKIWQFFQAWIIMFKNKHNLWIFYL